MSRMERHKKHREGGITYHQSTDFEKIEDSYHVNPIASKDDDGGKRKKTYERNKLNEIELMKNKDIKKINEITSQQKEVFDIEVAFKNIEQKRRESHVDTDTQAQIISEIFSKDFSGYQDVKLQKDEDTNKILISEEELLKLLDEREKNHQKARERKQRKERLLKKQQDLIDKQSKQTKKEVKPVVKSKPKTDVFFKDEDFFQEEDFIKEEVVKQQPVTSKPRYIKEEDHLINDFEPKEFYNNKSTTILKIVLVGLVLVLAYVLYVFFR